MKNTIYEEFTFIDDYLIRYKLVNFLPKASKKPNNLIV